MALNVFEYYGIKEVANVYFEALDADDKLGVKKGDIVMYLDTLKVSTVETTAQTTDATGGWANPKLISWDYGKEITVTLEDAVVTMEELAILLGAQKKVAGVESKNVTVRKNAEFTATSSATALPTGDGKTTEGKNSLPTAAPTNGYRWINFTKGTRGQVNASATLAATAWSSGDRVRIFWEETYTGNTEKEAVELVISPSTFPGTYRVVGDTIIRKGSTGKDEAFQFVINKAKLTSEVTLTMQAEGDPSTFSMTLNVLRDDNGQMMSLIKY